MLVSQHHQVYKKKIEVRTFSEFYQASPCLIILYPPIPVGETLLLIFGPAHFLRLHLLDSQEQVCHTLVRIGELDYCIGHQIRHTIQLSV